MNFVLIISVTVLIDYVEHHSHVIMRRTYTDSVTLEITEKVGSCRVVCVCNVGHTSEILDFLHKY